MTRCEAIWVIYFMTYFDVVSMCFRIAQDVKIGHLRIGVVSKVSGYQRLVRREIFLFLYVSSEITEKFDVGGKEIFKCSRKI